MPDWPLIFGSQRVASVGASGSSGTAVISSASANTKGAYAQLTASTAFAVDAVEIQITNVNNDQQDFLVDLAIGAAASEVVIAANLIAGSATDQPPSVYFLPIPIPAGTRLSARVSCPAGSKTVLVVVRLYSRGPAGSSLLQKVVTLGATTATTRGTSLDPGTSVNTKGAYAQLIASTVERYAAVCVGIGNQAQTTREATTWLVDIAIGGAGSEKIVIPDLMLASAVNRSVLPGAFPLVPVEIPSGVRVSARCSCSSTTATKRLVDVIVYGIA